MRAGRSGERLDAPFSLPRLPRGALLRSGAAAALLALAAGVLLSGAGDPPGRAGAGGALPCPGPAPAVSPAAPRPPPGTVGLPLRLADPRVAAVARPGVRVDVLVGADGSPTAATLAADVLVLDAPSPPDGAEGSLLYVAVTPEQARRLAGAPAGARVTVTVRAP